MGVAALAVTFVPAVTFLAATAVAHAVARVPLGVLTRDPTATLGGHPLTGVQSHLGVLIWWAAAAICLFAAVALRRAADEATRCRFLFSSAALTAVLTLDDLFQVHEDLVPRYLGLSDTLVIVAYGAAILAYLAVFRRLILRSGYALLVAGLCLFAASNAVDFVFQDRWLSEWRIFVEDGFKLLGIASWSAYLVRTALGAVVRVRSEVRGPRSKVVGPRS